MRLTLRRYLGGIGKEISADGFLQRRFAARPGALGPADQAVILCFVVVHADFDAHKTVGNEKLHILRIIGNPSQIGVPDFHPGVPALPHLKGQCAFFPGHVKRLVHRDAVDNPHRHSRIAQERRGQMGIVLAVAPAGAKRVERIVLRRGVYVTDMVHHVAHHFLYGFKLRFRPAGEFLRKFPNGRIIGLHLLRGLQIVLQIAGDGRERKRRDRVNRFQTGARLRVKRHHRVNAFRNIGPGCLNGFIAAGVLERFFLLGVGGKRYFEIGDFLAVGGRIKTGRLDKTHDQFSHRIAGHDLVLQFIVDRRVHLPHDRKVLGRSRQSGKQQRCDQCGFQTFEHSRSPPSDI